jgi:DNA-binding MarR family transcriptional regulator
VLGSLAVVAGDDEHRRPSVERIDALIRERVAVDAPGADQTVLLASIGLVRVAMRLTADFESAVHRRLGLTWAGYRLLFCLWIAGPLPSRVLAQLMWATPSTASSVLNTVERQGLVTRERNEQDRRSVTVTLTDAGRALVLEAFGDQHARETQWLSALSRPELETLLGLLGTLATAPHPGPLRRRPPAGLVPGEPSGH